MSSVVMVYDSSIKIDFRDNYRYLRPLIWSSFCLRRCFSGDIICSSQSRLWGSPGQSAILCFCSDPGRDIPELCSQCVCVYSLTTWYRWSRSKNRTIFGAKNWAVKLYQTKDSQAVRVRQIRNICVWNLNCSIIIELHRCMKKLCLDISQTSHKSTHSRWEEKKEQNKVFPK